LEVVSYEMVHGLFNSVSWIPKGGRRFVYLIRLRTR
jgi:hypothetical protein